MYNVIEEFVILQLFQVLQASDKIKRRTTLVYITDSAA